jgi:hypothetical protein
MKFSVSFAIFVAATAVSAAAIAENPPVQDTAMKERDAGLEEPTLEKRACKENGCKCITGMKQGQYCGLCITNKSNGPFVIKNYGTGGGYYHKYECNPKGGCCDYGFSYDCDEGAIQCAS